MNVNDPLGLAGKMGSPYRQRIDHTIVGRERSTRRARGAFLLQQRRQRHRSQTTSRRFEKVSPSLPGDLFDSWIIRRWLHLLFRFQSGVTVVSCWSRWISGNLASHQELVQIQYGIGNDGPSGQLDDIAALRYWPQGIGGQLAGFFRVPL